LSVFFDLDGELHIGRHPRHQIANVGRILRSPTAKDDEGGFSGCIASLELNGIVRNLLDQSFIIRSRTQDSIVSGCSGEYEWYFPCIQMFCFKISKCIAPASYNKLYVQPVGLEYMIVRRTRLSTVSDRSFLVAASRIWNGQP
jgi:hypothetical protein